MNMRRPGVLGRLLLLSFLSAAAPLVHADDFTIHKVDTRLAKQVYVMDVQAEYAFSSRALEALDSGVPLTLRMDIEVERQRGWLPDVTIATLEQYYQIYYHALSQGYLVRNLNSGALYSFPSQQEAIAALSDLRDFPLLDAKLISPGERYEIQMRVVLDIDSLPSPLKLIAYVTPSWHLSSDWYAWSLKP